MSLYRSNKQGSYSVLNRHRKSLPQNPQINTLDYTSIGGKETAQSLKCSNSGSMTKLEKHQASPSKPSPNQYVYNGQLKSLKLRDYTSLHSSAKSDHDISSYLKNSSTKLIVPHNVLDPSTFYSDKYSLCKTSNHNTQTLPKYHNTTLSLSNSKRLVGDDSTASTQPTRLGYTSPNSIMDSQYFSQIFAKGGQKLHFDDHESEEDGGVVINVSELQSKQNSPRKPIKEGQSDGVQEYTYQGSIQSTEEKIQNLNTKVNKTNSLIIEKLILMQQADSSRGNSISSHPLYKSQRRLVSEEKVQPSIYQKILDTRQMTLKDLEKLTNKKKKSMSPAHNRLPAKNSERYLPFKINKKSHSIDTSIKGFSSVIGSSANSKNSLSSENKKSYYPYGQSSKADSFLSDGQDVFNVSKETDFSEENLEAQKNALEEMTKQIQEEVQTKIEQNENLDDCESQLIDLLQKSVQALIEITNQQNQLQQSKDSSYNQFFASRDEAQGEEGQEEKRRIGNEPIHIIDQGVDDTQNRQLTEILEEQETERLKLSGYQGFISGTSSTELNKQADLFVASVTVPDLQRDESNSCFQQSNSIATDQTY